MNISSTFIITILILAIALIVWEIIINKKSVIIPQGDTLIYGAGEAGKIIAERIIEKCKYINWDFSRTKLVGFLDDDPEKKGYLEFTYPNGTEIPILGGYKKLDESIIKYNISSVIITIGNPGCNLQYLPGIITCCKKHEVNCFQFDFKFDRLA